MTFPGVRSRQEPAPGGRKRHFDLRFCPTDTERTPAITRILLPQLLRVVLPVALAIAGLPGTPEASDRAVVLSAGGDIMPVLATAGVIAARGTDYPFAEIAPVLRQADLVFANLEAPLTDQGRPTPGKARDDLAASKDYLFRGSPQVAGALRRAGVTVLSVANNHAMDYGPEGLLDMLRHLRRAGVQFAGAGATLDAARRPAIATIRGMRIAFLAYSDVLPHLSVATPTSPGIAPAWGRWTGRPAEDEIIDDIRAAGTGADHVVVSVHWGEEGQTLPNCRQIALGNRMLAAGARVVLGHHPHVLQPVAATGSRLIAYSLGNLIASPRTELARESALLKVALAPRGVVSWELVPLFMTGGQPQSADQGHARAIAGRVSRAARCPGRPHSSAVQ